MNLLILGMVFSGFLIGSIPFSLLIPRWLKGVDVRQFGDGNPGSANAFKAGGWACGIFALLLDYLKGCLPVLLANSYLSIDKVWIILIAIAPILGHAFSPFLGFKGGKAIATTFGVWTGLTLYKAPLVLGGFCAFFLYLLKSSACFKASRQSFKVFTSKFKSALIKGR